jgi:type IV pilus assembly protein PilW
MTHRSLKSREKGLTLIELLVAMTLGLLLIGGAIGFFLSTKQANLTLDALSRNQESGRFAMSLLTQNIRLAGYAGCSNLQDITPNVIAMPTPTHGFDLNSTIIGFDNASANVADHAPTGWLEGTDFLVISHVDDCAADLTAKLGSLNGEIVISSANNCDFAVNDYLLITDCETADLFRATAVSVLTSESKEEIDHACTETDPRNTTANLSRQYRQNSTVMKFYQSTYFIGKNTNKNPALYKKDHTGSAVELVDNVADMQIRYGTDTNADGIVDTYQNANDISDWGRVLSVELSLLIRSDDHALGQPQTVTFNGTDLNDGNDADKRLRSIFNSSVSIRNRLH